MASLDFKTQSRYPVDHILSFIKCLYVLFKKTVWFIQYMYSQCECARWEES